MRLRAKTAIARSGKVNARANRLRNVRMRWGGTPVYEQSRWHGVLWGRRELVE